MKKLIVVIVVLVAAVGAASLIMKGGNDHNANTHEPTPPANQAVKQSTQPPVPAHFKEPPRHGSLGPTLPPERFAGQAQQAYMVAKAIPQTLAQLPCYCHCDRGMGHKSLHSCFEDDHASHCAVCVEEALLAYRLQKEQNLSAEQVREKIIEKYGDL